jgi:hypothetical protein
MMCTVYADTTCIASSQVPPNSYVGRRLTAIKRQIVHNSSELGNLQCFSWQTASAGETNREPKRLFQPLSLRRDSRPGTWLALMETQQHKGDFKEP